MQPWNQPPQSGQPNPNRPHQTGQLGGRRPAGNNQQPSSWTRSEKRQAKARMEDAVRRGRWSKNRLAIPYPTDGPKITLGVLWFGYVCLAILAGDYLQSPDLAPVIVAMMLAPVAGLAGLQTGNAWYGALKEVRWFTGFAALVFAVVGFLGVQGVGIGVAAAAVVLLVALAAAPGVARNASEQLDVMARAALPVGLAVSSMVAIVGYEYEHGSGAYVLMSLVVLVSSYEAGDFLVGSGSNNAIEGPLSGVITMLVSAFALFMVSPTAFPSPTMVLLFCALTAICCPLGQIFASALMPQATAWAPALRRLDSYLVAAPLWLFLIVVIGF